jgi:uncharacterized protein (TIGR02246 family)
MSETITIPRRTVATVVALGAVAAATTSFAQGVEKPNPEVAALKALIDAHDKAFSAHDTKGVLALFAANATILGVGPGEIWGGHDEIASAYGHFFADFDAGKHKTESLWFDGHVLGNMAWLMSITKVTMNKGTASVELGLNLSVVFEKTASTWLIRAMHFSNLTGGATPEKK